jgi:molecular chaperone GrpE (heat shock protein)
MSEGANVKLSKGLLFVFDVIFVGLAGWIVYAHKDTAPLTPWEAGAVAACVIAGAWLSITPFMMEYRAAADQEESANLNSSLAQIQNLEKIAEQIAIATAQWQIAQENSTKSIEAAGAIGTRMSAEAKAFAEFMQRTNDTEKATLRLEVEKLRRSEGEWLQISTRLLDHVYALYQAAVRSGQPALIQQLGNFQTGCRDVTRRIGLIPFVAEPGTPFDANLHQPVDEKSAGVVGGAVAETIVTGYTFQGQLLRRAVVAFASEVPAVSVESEGEATRGEDPSAEPVREAGEDAHAKLL